MPRRHRRRAVRRRRRPVRCALEPGRRRAHGVHAAGADRLRRALQLLHHPDDARRRPLAAAGDVDSRRQIARVVAPATGRSPSPACISARTAGICGDGSTLTALVRDLAEWPDDVLFRISSLEPMDCTPEIVDLVAASPRLAPHFHLPLQHGVGRRCCARCGGRTRAAYYRRPRRTDPRAACRTRRSGPTSSSAFPARRDAHFDETRVAARRAAADAPSRLSRTRIGRAPRRARCADKVDGADDPRARRARARDRRRNVRALPALAGRHGRGAR